MCPFLDILIYSRFLFLFIISNNRNVQDTIVPNENSYRLHTPRPSFDAISISVTERRSSLSSSKKNEIALAKVSMAIVLIFIICHSVRWIPNVYELVRIVRGQKEDWPVWIESLTNISHFLTTLNSSANFYIYCFKHFSKSASNSTNRCSSMCTMNCCKQQCQSSSVVCLESKLLRFG